MSRYALAKCRKALRSTHAISGHELNEPRLIVRELRTIVGSMPKMQHGCGKAPVLALHAAAHEAEDDVGILPAPATVGGIKAVDALKVVTPDGKIAAAGAAPVLSLLLAQRPERQSHKRRQAIDIAGKAREGLMMTFAFGMNDVFKEVYRSGSAPFRLALMEKASGPKRTKEAKKAEERKIQVLRNMPENTFAIGSLIKTNKIDGWVKERLTGLNTHVRYIHNKFMLIDPLGNDPIVVGGSANFSKASTEKNDENMLVVRGDKRVADIYLGEFMRLYSHHAFRESLTFRGSKPPKPLRTDDWWKDYFGETPRSVRRRFFSRSSH